MKQVTKYEYLLFTYTKKLARALGVWSDNLVEWHDKDGGDLRAKEVIHINSTREYYISEEL